VEIVLQATVQELEIKLRKALNNRDEVRQHDPPEGVLLAVKLSRHDDLPGRNEPVLLHLQEGAKECNGGSFRS